MQHISMEEKQRDQRWGGCLRLSALSLYQLLLLYILNRVRRHSSHKGPTAGGWEGQVAGSGVRAMGSGVRDCRSGLTWRPAARDLHVELDGVHAQDGLAHVAQHVVGGGHTHEGRQLHQLLELLLPPAGDKGRSISSVQ